MSGTDFRTLGRSGLVVTPLALGTMTFGTPGWGSSDDVSQAIFDAYIEAGGNFIDTADVYADGRSEELLGGFIAARRLRDRIVLATKFGFHGGEDGDVNGGGNGRKNIHRALHGSLRRLGVDHVDLYWLHVWDTITPVAEVLQTLGDLVRAGTIRYFGFSDVPAWYAAKAAALASAHGVPGPIALQLAYSLVERTIEREHIPAARDAGLGLTPWSPLGAGFLSGKYARDASGAPVAGGGRLDRSDSVFRMFTERNWRILDALRAVASEHGRPPAQVALAWAAARPGVSSLILGASTVAQLHDNLGSLDLELGVAGLRALDDASALEPVFPYPIFEPDGRAGIFGGATVRGWD